MYMFIVLDFTAFRRHFIGKTLKVLVTVIALKYASLVS